MREPEALRALERLERSVEQLPGVTHATSIVDLVRVLNRAVEAGDPAQERIPDTRAGVAELLQLVPKGDVQRLLTTDHARANLVVRTGTVGSEAVRALAASLERSVADVRLPPSLRVSVTGNAILLSRSADGIASGQMQAVCLAAGSIFLLILAGLRSLPLAVIAMIPNVVPVLLFFGLLGAGIAPLSLPTSLIAQRGSRHRDRRHRALHRALPGGANGGPRSRPGLAAREPERRDGDRHRLRDAGGRLLDHRALGLRHAASVRPALRRHHAAVPRHGSDPAPCPADALEGVIRFRLDAWKLSALVAGLAAFGLLLGVEGPLHRTGRTRLAAGAGGGRDRADGDLVALRGAADPLDGLRAAGRLPVQRRLLEPPGWQNAQRVVEPYFDAYIFLFLGGMCIAAAMQQWNLHRRIALVIMRAIGTDPRRLLFGFLAATAFISLWISNTATATMMLPIGLSVIAQLEDHAGGRRLEHYGASLMLAIAYARERGRHRHQDRHRAERAVRGLHGAARRRDLLPRVHGDRAPLRRAVPPARLARRSGGPAGATPPMPRRGATCCARRSRTWAARAASEWVVLGVFLAAAALWIAGRPLTGFLAPRVTLVELSSARVEAAIAMSAAFVLMLVRVRGRAMLELRFLRYLPFETLLLLGGSLAMAAAIEASGLSAWLAGQLATLREAPAWAQLLLASVATVALSAVASNVATIAVMLSVLEGSVAPAIATTALFTATIAASLRLRAAGRDAAQRDRLRERLRLGAAGWPRPGPCSTSPRRCSPPGSARCWCRGCCEARLSRRSARRRRPAAPVRAQRAKLAQAERADPRLDHGAVAHHQPDEPLRRDQRPCRRP